MALKSTLSLTLALLTAGTLALGIQACSGGGGDDDDDAATTPVNNANICTILWAKPSGDGVQNRFDIYTWQAAVEFVDQGAGTYVFNTNYLDSVFGFLYYRSDITAGGQIGDPQVFGIATNGDWNISVLGGLLPGDTFEWADSGSNEYFNLDGAKTASYGTGSFTGVISSNDPDDDVTPGTGSISVAVATTANLSIGAISYAQCFEAPPPSFTAVTAEQYSRMMVGRMMQRHLAR